MFGSCFRTLAVILSVSDFKKTLFMCLDLVLGSCFRSLAFILVSEICFSLVRQDVNFGVLAPRVANGNIEA